ncbi:MAG: hypothetical protein ACTSR8_11960 [Promethearchaeota archaeon]
MVGQSSYDSLLSIDELEQGWVMGFMRKALRGESGNILESGVFLSQAVVVRNGMLLFGSIEFNLGGIEYDSNWFQHTSLWVVFDLDGNEVAYERLSAQDKPIGLAMVAITSFIEGGDFNLVAHKVRVTNQWLAYGIEEPPSPTLFTVAKEREKIYARTPFTKSQDTSNVNSRLAALASVLWQLEGYYSFRLTRTGISKFYPLPDFFNIHCVEDKYSIQYFNQILSALQPRQGDPLYGDGSILDPTSEDYWLKKIFRVRIEGSELRRNSISELSELLDSWKTFIINDLNRETPLLPEDIRLRLTTCLADDKALLIELIGWPAYVCLISGMMVASKSLSSMYGYSIEFVLHDKDEQALLLNNFVERIFPIFSMVTESYNEEYFHTGSIEIERFFGSLILFYVDKSKSYFLNEYFGGTFAPEQHSDYVAAWDIIWAEFSGANIVPKGSRIINDLNLKGRADIHSFLLKKFQLSVTDDFASGSYADLLQANLMHFIVSPTSDNDLVKILRNVLFTGESSVITLKKGGGPELSITISYNDLVRSITPEMVFTMMFTYQFNTRDTLRSTNYRDGSGYFMDFNLLWNNLESKMQIALDRLTSIFHKAPAGSKMTAYFYVKQNLGISSKKLITSYKSRGFVVNRFEFDPHDEFELKNALLTVMYWSMMNPDFFINFKMNDGVKDYNYLFYDILAVHDQSYILVPSSPNLALKGEFWWETSGRINEYYQFISSYSGLVMQSVIMDFKSFHNYELCSATNMEEYILNFYFRSFSDNTRILDLYSGNFISSLEGFVFRAGGDDSAIELNTAPDGGKKGPAQFWFPDDSGYRDPDLLPEILSTVPDFDLADCSGWIRMQGVPSSPPYEIALMYWGDADEDNGLEHILVKHFRDFQEAYGDELIRSHTRLARFILYVMKNKDPDYKQLEDKYIFWYKIPGCLPLKVVMSPQDMHIITAYPDKTPPSSDLLG